MNEDGINGCFEFGGSLLLILNVIRIIRDKKIAGVSILPTILFTAWGFWNLRFYPRFHLWWSFYGAVFMVTVQVIWITLALYYIIKDKLKQGQGPRKESHDKEGG